MEEGGRSNAARSIVSKHVNYLSVGGCAREKGGKGGVKDVLSA